MALAAFDTLEFVDTLEKAGIPELQARAMSVAVRKAYESSDVATKQDIAELRHEIGDLRKDNELLRKDMDAKLEKLFLKLIIWLGSIVFLLINTGPILPKLLHIS